MIHLHTDKATGIKHYATTIELKRIRNRDRRYRRGSLPPNYPVPAIRYRIAIQSKGVAVINLSESTIDCVITERNHIVYDH